jgi:hypothetical protein
MTIKDYLGTENARNKQHAALYARLIKRAFGENNDVLIGHHLTFEDHGDINTENEIPAADTLLFDHDIMGRVFGGDAKKLMVTLAMVPAEKREALVEAQLKAMEG